MPQTPTEKEIWSRAADLSNSVTSVRPLIEALENCYTELAAEWKLPPATIVVASGDKGRGNLNYGHFHADIWTDAEDNYVHEIQIGAEGIERGGTAILGTFIHEAAHAYCQINDIKDCSRGNRYHNKKFKRVAEMMGLTIEYDESIGWSTTTVPAETEAKYQHHIDAIERTLKLYRTYTGPTATASDRNNPAARCDCNRVIRASKKVLRQDPIFCGLCGTEFVNNVS